MTPYGKMRQQSLVQPSGKWFGNSSDGQGEHLEDERRHGNSPACEGNPDARNLAAELSRSLEFPDNATVP